jgi:hypothetical protein
VAGAAKFRAVQSIDDFGLGMALRAVNGKIDADAGTAPVGPFPKS